MKKFLLTTLFFAVTSLVMRASLQHHTVNITFSEDDFELSEHDGVLHIIPADLFAWYPEGNVPGLPKISANFTINGKVDNKDNAQIHEATYSCKCRHGANSWC